MRTAAARRAPLVRAVLGVLAVLAAACADPSPKSRPARGARPPGPSLLDRIADAKVSGDLAGLDGSLDAPSASRIVLREEFDRELDAAGAPEPTVWFDGAWLGELRKDAKSPQHARAAIGIVDGASCADLDAAAGSLNRFLSAPESASFLVTARVRVPADAAGAGLWIIPHRNDAPAPGQLAASVLSPAMENPGQRATLDAAPTAGWRDVELFVPPQPGRRSFSVSLLPSAKGAQVDRLVVRRLAFAAALHWTPRVSFDQPSPDDANRELSRVLTLARGATCEALLVPSPASVTFEVDVPATNPRLQFGAGALGESAGGTAELVVTVDRERLVGFSAPVAPPALALLPKPKTLDLSRFAGRRIALTLTAKAEGDVVGVFAAPALIGAPKPPAAGGGARRNLLLISLDTLRADVVGCYGDTRGLSPAIDAVAAAGRRFATTWSPSCYTLPTHMSVMTGQHPLVHRAFSPLEAVDPQRSPSLAARLRAAGWRTAAFTGGGFVQPLHGFGQGFESYGVDDPLGRTSLRRDAQKNEAAAAEAAAVGADPLAPTLAWLGDHADQPFFLFVHTYFVHNYTPKPEYLARVGAGGDATAPIAGDEPLKLRELAKQGDAAALARLRALYAGTLAQADDRLVARLLARLDELGLAANTVVSILSDHGEEQLEHGGAGHGHELFQECTRVPWILRGPGVPVGVEASPVELADVAPTLARLLGLAPDPWMHAHDRLASLNDGDDEAAALVLVLDGRSAPPVRDALVLGPWKLMRFDREGALEQRLFDLTTDPLEQRDLAAREPARVRALAQRLELRRRELDELARSLPGSELELTHEQLDAQREAMHELGYFDE